MLSLITIVDRSTTSTIIIIAYTVSVYRNLTSSYIVLYSSLNVIVVLHHPFYVTHCCIVYSLKKTLSEKSLLSWGYYYWEEHHARWVFCHSLCKINHINIIIITFHHHSPLSLPLQ